MKKPLKLGFKIISLSILSLLLAGGLVFLVWGSSPNEPSQRALDALRSNDQVRVELNPKGWVEFVSREEGVHKGFILLPGAHVDYRAYAPLAQAIAAQGFLVLVPSMPLNFALLGLGRAKELYRAYPKIDSWAIGGHSLGGVAASIEAQESGLWSALILIASYPPDSVDLSARKNLRVLAVRSGLDGLINAERYQKSLSRLPSNMNYLLIEGGNHGQFGDYGEQSGDKSATISIEVQQQMTANSIADTLDSM